MTTSSDQRVVRVATASADERCDAVRLSDDEAARRQLLRGLPLRAGGHLHRPGAARRRPAAADPHRRRRRRQLGAAYADNDWIYDVCLAGTLVCSGADLHSGGIARTHAQMAVVLAEYLADTATGAAAPARRTARAVGLDERTEQRRWPRCLTTLGDRHRRPVSRLAGPAGPRRVRGRARRRRARPGAAGPRPRQPDLANGVYVPQAADAIVAAWQCLRRPGQVLRYLRMFHGVTAIAVARTADLDVLIFDTADFRATSA